MVVVRGGKIRAAGLALALVAAPAAAYERPLGNHSVREAYFLGSRKDEKTEKFLGQYLKRLPVPKSGPHVAEVQLLTPYAHVVLRAFRAPGNYSAQQAAQDYAARPDRIRLRVRINLTPTYPGYVRDAHSKTTRERPPDFWRDFKIEFSQGRVIAPNSVTGKPIYTSAFQAPPPLAGALQGADVWLEFDAARVDSAPVRIEVETPDGQRVEAEFDLKDLR